MMNINFQLKKTSEELFNLFIGMIQSNWVNRLSCRARLKYQDAVMLLKK
jgi:hypothetical protein